MDNSKDKIRQDDSMDNSLKDKLHRAASNMENSKDKLHRVGSTMESSKDKLRQVGSNLESSKHLLVPAINPINSPNNGSKNLLVPAMSPQNESKERLLSDVSISERSTLLYDLPGTVEDRIEPGYSDPKVHPIPIPVFSSSLSKMYKVVNCISRGSPSSVYILETPDTKELYAHKMTECFDESEAIRAYNEAMELKRLDHMYVSAYKEFFVTYDKLDSSMFINIVMQYFPEGNLRTLIRRYQNVKRVMPEQMVKKILGEILEGLVYIHGCGFVHKNIKPSNVFLRPGGSVVLADIGISTLMGDLRTNTRQTFAGTVFMAPEIGQRNHDERSDLYSVGGILLNMLTTSMLPEYEFYQKLKKIKDSYETFTVILEDVSEIYTKSMVNTVQTLLRNKHNVRPGILEFTKSGFIQECMAQVDSVEVTVETTQQKASESARKLSLGENRENIQFILQHLSSAIDQDGHIAEALAALADILRDNDSAHLSVDEKARCMISTAMWDNIYNKDVQVYGCYTLSNLAVFSKPDDILFTTDVISIVHRIITSYEYDPEVQLAAVDLILSFSADEKASRFMVQNGAIQQILLCMKHARYHATLNAICCMALWSLAVNSENLKVACKENAIKDVCLALSTHKVSPDVCEAASAALVSLLLDDSCYEGFSELDCPGNLVFAIHLHKNNMKVVKNCCKVLAFAVEENEESAYEFLASVKEEVGAPTGISVVMEAYKVHKDNADVVESIVRLLLELSSYENICSEMQTAFIGPVILLEVSKRHKHNLEIMVPVKAALDRLGNIKTHIDHSKS